MNELFIRLLDEKLYESGIAPSYEGDAGIDLRARHDVVVHAGSTAKIPLGVSVAIPRGNVGWLTSRSTTALSFGLITHEGKIDSGYRGEIHAFVTAQGSPVKIERGERICQLVVLRILEPHSWTFVESEDLMPTGEQEGYRQRGDQGLGSTGRM